MCYGKYDLQKKKITGQRRERVWKPKAKADIPLQWSHDRSEFIMASVPVVICPLQIDFFSESQFIKSLSAPFL